MTSPALSRISGVVLRHLAVYRYNLMRWQDFLFWPMVELLLWGFMALYVQRLTTLQGVLAVLLGAIFLWNVFARTNQFLGISLLMELWSRNLINVFVTPISILEYLIGIAVSGLLRVLLLALMLFAAAFAFYQVNLFSLGPALVPFAVALILFGWVAALLVMGMVLRFGQSAESLAFGFAFLLQPFGAVFFPLSVYPPWLRAISWWIPLPHVFEGMRAVLAGQDLPLFHLLWAFGLDLVYLLLAFAFFGFMFEKARAKGFLLKIQE